MEAQYVGEDDTITKQKKLLAEENAKVKEAMK